MEPTEWRMNMMREWAAGEGTGAGYNPLATTQQGLEDPEDPYWNDNGGNPVKNYRDFDSGVAQTVRTLKNGYYDKILASFQNEAIVPGAGNEARTWGTVHFANVLDGNASPTAGGGGAYSGDTTGLTPDEFKLPFTEEEYRQKYARSQEILSQIWDPDLKAIRPDADQALVNEYLGLDSELKSYDDVIARGGHDFSDYMNWVNYQNQSRQIDATNAANQAARQLQINSAAEDATMKELQEQRARADSAIQDQALFRKASHFDSPMGFRVGQENPMPEDQVFAKKVSEISDKVGPYVPIPQNIDIGPFSSYRTKAPIATKADTSLDPQKGPQDFYPGWETNGSATQVPPALGTWNPLAIAQQGANVFGQQGFKPSQLTYQPWNQKPFNAVQTPSPTAIQNFSNAVQQRSPFTLAGASAPSSRPQGSAFAETARGAARKIVGSLLFGGSR